MTVPVESVGDARRILIAGGPRSGKTTLADSLGKNLNIPVCHTDDLIGQLEWSEASLAVSRWFGEPGPWIIEGVSVPRALRKWFAAQPETPAELIFWLGAPAVPLTNRQRGMAKACETVWREVAPAVTRSGMRIVAP